MLPTLASGFAALDHNHSMPDDFSIASHRSELRIEMIMSISASSKTFIGRYIELGRIGEEDDVHPQQL
jgi:hypothetical protein